MYEPQNRPAVQSLHGQITRGFCPVWVAYPRRHSRSDCWTGNERNRTKPLTENWTAGVLPRRAANTGCDREIYDGRREGKIEDVTWN